MVKKLIKDIVIKKELYPREKINNNKIQEYREYLENMPPIIINQDNILIDGAHRYYAYKENKIEEIEVEVIQTKDDDDLFLRAIEFNAKHGYQLTQKEKKKHIENLYNKIINKKAKSFDVKRLKETFSIPNSTFSDWTKDLEDKIEAQRLQLILDLYLQNKTQEEIGEIIGLKHNTVSDKIKEICLKFKELSENPNSEIPTKYEFLKEKCKELSEFKPFLYNIWNIKNITNNTLYFGNFPVEFMENLLYYYTEPFSIVYDPFAGGGVTIDACKKWFRRYYVSDSFPIPAREEEIKKWKIQEGLPDDLPKLDFVFLDPPYWKQAEGKYSNEKYDLGNMSLNDFYECIETFVKQVKKRLNDNGKIALIIQPTQWKNDLILEHHGYELTKRFEKLGFKINHWILCPYSTEQYNAQQIIKSKEKRICLELYRDLIIFEKREE